MKKYNPRKAEFLRIHEADGWLVKVYTLTKYKHFSSRKVLENALDKLPEWLENSRNYDLPNFNIACLIVHESKEGIFSLLNWWTDENMLQNHVFLTPVDKPNEFELFSDRGIACCIWELGIIWHERNAWVKHVLKNPENPEFNKYLSDTFNGEV